MSYNEFRGKPSKSQIGLIYGIGCERIADTPQGIECFGVSVYASHVDWESPC
jgi:hypothetical protein